MRLLILGAGFGALIVSFCKPRVLPQPAVVGHSPLYKSSLLFLLLLLLLFIIREIRIHIAVTLDVLEQRTQIMI